MEAKIKLADQGSSFRGKTCEGKTSDVRGFDSRVYTECRRCQLMSCHLGICYFCEQGNVDVCDDEKQRKENTTHNTHNEQCTCQQFRDQGSLQVTFLQPTRRDTHHANQARVDQQVGEGRSSCSQELDHSSNASTLGRFARGEQKYTSDGHGEQDQRFEVSSPEERHLGRLCHSGRWTSDQQNDHPSDLQSGRTSDHGEVRAPGHGGSGFRHAWRQDLRGDLQGESRIHQVGHGHSQGGTGVALASEEIGTLGNSSTARGDSWLSDANHQWPQEGDSQGQGQSSVHRKFLDGGGRGIWHGGSISCWPRDAREGFGDSTSPQPAQPDGEGEGRATVDSEPHQESQGDVSELGLEERLPEAMAARLAKEWHIQKNPYSQQFSSLVQHERPLLMELACYPNSLLSAEVIQRFGEGSAIRCSEWNGGDLETESGVKHAKKIIRRYRPLHLWISCTCGPFCPLQRLNRRNPQQIANLEEKQRKARFQYQGAMEVAREGKKYGTQVHWEFSEKSEAWKLPEVQDFIAHMQMEKVTCHGCAVGLKTLDNKKALCKGWTIATKNVALLQHLHLKCQRNHEKGKCEAGQAAHTARYTQPFVRKVIDSLCELEPWPKTVQELLREESAQPAAEDAGDEDGEDVEQVQFEPGERESIEKKIQHIHRSTGHGSLKNLYDTLQQRGVSDKVLFVAKHWRCIACEARKRKDPRKFATLDTIPKRWQRVQMDMGSWCHPKTKQKFHFVMMIDEASRFRMARVVSYNAANDTKWDVIKKVFEESWIPIFGQPQVLRVDPQGPMVSKNADKYAEERGLELQPIPAEAHWQISIVEGAIKTTKGMLETLARDYSEMEPTELLGRAVWVANSRDLFRGYAPIQHALGKCPDEHDHLFEQDYVKPVGPELLDDGGFREDHKIRCKAEQCFSQEQAKRRLERAERMGHRRAQVFIPGDIVFYWRNQVPLKDKTTQRVGRFLGPARVIATETRRDNHGELRPGSIVWLHRAGRLIRAAPEQLRQASPLEIQIEEFKGPVELPWTISSLATAEGGRTFLDISHEIPDDEQWDGAQEFPSERPQQEELIPITRKTKKGPGDIEPSKRRTLNPPTGQKRSAEEDIIDERGNAGGASSSSRPRRTEDDAEELEFSAFYSQEEHCKAIEIELEIPESKRGMKKFLENPEAFMANQIKRRQVEVRERTLSPAEAVQFTKAKDTEVRNFIAAECFQRATEKFPEEKNIVGMRWLLTWKYDEKYKDQGGRKAKARAIVLGYQDPRYEERKTSAPTPSKSGRQLFFQYCAWQKMRLSKGDISGAFLQGQDLSEELWCRPVKEICEELGVSEGTPMLLKKAAYGLVQAPLHWYQSISTYLEEIGYHKLWTEPCCWIWVDKEGVVRSIIHGHVDDFMFGGRDNDEIHTGLMRDIQKKFQWGTWETGQFVQCGVHVQQHEDFSIDLEQTKFIEELEEIHISRERSRSEELTTTEDEKRALRGVLGSLSWLCGQTCFLFSVDVNFLITSIPVSTVGDLNRANKLVRDIKKWKHLKYKIHTFDSQQGLDMVVWTDAGWANRPNGKDSTEGIFVGLTDKRLQQGWETNVTPIHWRSGKIERTCRSPACAETMASLDGEDDLTYLRILWNEMRGIPICPRDVDQAASHTTGYVITDARNLFDKLSRATPVVKGAEKRSDIEAISLRENLDRGNSKILWVNGNAMLANSLTKPQEKSQLMLYVHMGFRWKVIYDENMMSGKKRTRLGLGAFSAHNNTQEENKQQERK